MDGLVKIDYFFTKSSIGLYRPLLNALVGKLTCDEQKRCVIPSGLSRKLIDSKKLLNAFDYVGTKDEQLAEGETKKCLCGCDIRIINYVRHNETQIIYKIGNVCIRNWFEDEQIKASKKCWYCGRANKSQENCKNCSVKCKISEIFKAWRKQSSYERSIGKKRINFGKHTGSTIQTMYKNNLLYLHWFVEKTEASFKPLLRRDVTSYLAIKSGVSLP
jgi:hypothetical protein